jgi:hypothetical protein
VDVRIRTARSPKSAARLRCADGQSVCSRGALPVGVWWFGVLPHPVITQLLGGSAAATSVLVAGIAVLLASLGLLFAASRAGGPAFWVFSAAGTLLVRIVLMLLTRDFIRQEPLDAAGFTVPTAVAPQWGVIAIFVLLLVAAIGTVAWMVRQLAVAHASAETSQAAVARQAQPWPGLPGIYCRRPCPGGCA